MGKFYDSVPVSAIVRIRDMMYTVKDPFRLDQGDVSFDAPDTFKAAVAQAMKDNRTHYLPTSGIPQLRKAVAEKMRKKNGIPIGSDDEVLITNGGTHGLYAVMHALLEPGDEMIVPGPEWPPTMAICQAAQGVPVQVPLREELGWRWNIDEVEKAITPKTRVLYLNSPNNPTGRVFDRAELTLIAELCQEFDALCITDEIYEHILYDGAEHIPMMTLPGMRERSVLVNSCSKTYSVTGWRVGWVLASPDLTDGIRKVHDFLTVGAATPLQYAAVAALQAPDAYYAELGNHYDWRRRKLEGYLTAAGFRCFTPRGAYYTMTDISAFGFSDDTAFVQHLIHNVGLAGVPGSSFFSRPELGHHFVRFCFCKKAETLDAAGERLAKLQ